MAKKRRPTLPSTVPPTNNADLSSDEEELPAELRSTRYYHEGKLIFTVRPDKLPEIGDIVCDPFIQEGSKENEYLRMYRCPDPVCNVTHRTENWTKLRNHALEKHGLKLFKHTVASSERKQSKRCVKLRKKQRKSIRLKLTTQYKERMNPREQTLPLEPVIPVQSTASDNTVLFSH